MRDRAKVRKDGATSKRLWRQRYPDKARKRNAADCMAYYRRNRERINARRRVLRKLRECADLLRKVEVVPETGYGYTGKLVKYG